MTDLNEAFQRAKQKQREKEETERLRAKYPNLAGTKVERRAVLKLANNYCPRCSESPCACLAACDAPMALPEDGVA